MRITSGLHGQLETNYRHLIYQKAAERVYSAIMILGEKTMDNAGGVYLIWDFRAKEY